MISGTIRPSSRPGSPRPGAAVEPGGWERSEPGSGPPRAGVAGRGPRSPLRHRSPFAPDTFPLEPPGAPEFLRILIATECASRGDV